MKNIYYLISVLAVILFISFFLGNVNTKEGLTTPDNVKIATDAINNSSSEQKALISNVLLAPPTAAAAPTTRATAAAQTTRAPIVPTVPIAAAPTTRAPIAAAPTTRAPIAAAAQTTRGATAAAPTTRAPIAAAQTTRGATAGAAQTTRAPIAAAAAQTTRGATAAAASEEVMITNLDRQKLNEISKRYINQSTYINNLINHDTNFKNKVDVVLKNTQRINDDLIEIKEIIIDRLNK